MLDYVSLIILTSTEVYY